MLYEDIVVVKDGRYLGLLSTAQLLSVQRGKIAQQMHSLEEKGVQLNAAMTRLAESEGKLSAMFKASRDAIGVSKNGIHIYANPAYLKLFGIESDQKIIGTSILGSITPSQRPQIIENIRRRYLGEEIPQFYEARGLKANGTEFDAEFNVSTYELNGENYSLAVIRDITERKQTEESLRISRERYRMLFEQAPLGVILADRGGKILEMNPAALEILGSPTPEATKAIDLLKFPPLEVSGISEALQRCVDEGRESHGEYPYVSKWGKAVQLRLQYVPILDDRGATSLILIIIEDITQHKRAEDEIRLLAHTLASTKDCISIANLEDKIIYVNDAFLQTYKYAREELLGQPVLFLRSRNGSPGPNKVILEKTKEKGWYGELMNRRKDGTDFPIELWTSVVKDDGDKVIATVGVARDISERRRVEEALRHAQKMESVEHWRGASRTTLTMCLVGLWV